MYALLIRVDETLPWIELKGDYSTKREANKAARDVLKAVKIKVITLPEKRKTVKPLVSIKTVR